MSSVPLKNRVMAARASGYLSAILRVHVILGVLGAAGFSAEPRPREADRGIERAKDIRTPSFRTDVAPLLSKAGCNMGACHGNLNGKGGFKLSLRGEDPSFDYQSLTHDQSGRRISRFAPESSLIVLKPTGAILHEGGLRFTRDSIEARALVAWIATGAHDDRASAPPVKALRVAPSERILAPGPSTSHSP